MGHVVSERVRQVSETALAVLAADGLKGLTHRAVDAAAGLPPGSTANVHPTRAALIAGAVEALERADLAIINDLGRPTSTEQVAQVLAGLFQASLRPPMTAWSRARLILLLEHPEQVLVVQARFLDALTGLLAELGLDEPQRAARGCLDLFDGALLHQLTKPDLDRVGPPFGAVLAAHGAD